MSNKFDPQGRSKYLFVKTLADPAKPKKTELATTAPGVIDLSCGITPDGVTGFAMTPGETDATTMCSKVEETVPGISTLESGSFRMARASTPDTENYALFEAVKALADERAEGYVVFCLDGWNEDATPAQTGPDVGAIVDVWPVQVSSINAEPLAGSAMASYTVAFSHPGGPELNVAVVNGSGGSGG